MLPVPCLEPYVTRRNPLSGKMEPSHSGSAPTDAQLRFSICNSYIFGPYRQSVSSGPVWKNGQLDYSHKSGHQLINNLLVVTMPASLNAQKPVLASLTLSDLWLNVTESKGLGTVPILNARVTELWDKIQQETIAQGWGLPSWDDTRHDAIEMIFAIRFMADESGHEWMEKALNMRPLVEKLSQAGFDVKTHLDVFLKTKREA